MRSGRTCCCQGAPSVARTTTQDKGCGRFKSGSQNRTRGAPFLQQARGTTAQRKTHRATLARRACSKYVCIHYTYARTHTHTHRHRHRHRHTHTHTHTHTRAHTHTTPPNPQPTAGRLLMPSHRTSLIHVPTNTLVRPSIHPPTRPPTHSSIHVSHLLIYSQGLDEVGDDDPDTIPMPSPVRGDASSTDSQTFYADATSLDSSQDAHKSKSLGSLVGSQVKRGAGVCVCVCV
jgi:hypothetical protein